MSWSIDATHRLDGRTAIVTGANGGIGREVARGLARLGARVTLAVRSLERGQVAADDIRSDVDGAAVAVMQLDLGSLASIRTFSARYHEEVETLDLLLNNAGLMKDTDQRTQDGFAQLMGVNHLGHFALTGRLLDLLLAAPAARVSPCRAGWP